MNNRISVVVLAAGLGTRMKSKLAKVLHCVGGQTLAEHVVQAACAITPPEDITVVVVGAGAAGVACTEIMLAQGVGDVIVCDRPGALYAGDPSLNAAQAELERRGVIFVSAPHMIHQHDDGTEEWMGFFNDPDGRPLGLMQQMPAT